jgi:hypothetical protein
LGNRWISSARLEALSCFQPIAEQHADKDHLTEKQYTELRQEVKTIHAPLHGLIKAVQKETGPLGNIVALIASAFTIVETRCITG